MSARLAQPKKRGGKEKKQQPIAKDTPPVPSQTIQIRELEVVALPLRPSPRMPFAVLK